MTDLSLAFRHEFEESNTKAEEALAASVDAANEAGQARALAAQARADAAAARAGSDAGVIGYATRNELLADLEHPAGTIGYVTNDPTPANNGTYRKAGASGVGTWEQSSFDRVAQVEAQVEPVVEAGGASALRRGLTGVAHAHPFVRDATLAANANLGGLTREAAQTMVERAVVDVALYDTDPSETYLLDRVRRNASGGWFISVRRQSDGVTCAQFLTAADPEPSDPSLVSRHRMTGINNNDFTVTGDVWVRWQDVVVGNNNSGLGMTLAPTVKRRRGGGRSREQLTPTLYEIVSRGSQHAIITDPGATFGFAIEDGILYWDGFTVPDDLHPSGRARVEAGSIELDTAYQVAWLDLEAARAYTVAPASTVKVGIYTDDSGSEFRGLPHQIPLACQAAGGIRYLLPAARAAAAAFGGSPGPGGGYDSAEVVARVVGDDRLDVYMHPNGEDSAAYVLYRLQRIVRADVDVWTIQGAWEAARTGDTAFTLGKRLAAESPEWLCAIQEQGKSDFMGGRAHGDETTEEMPTLLVDGREVPISSTGWHRAREVAFVQRSSLWEVGSDLTNRRAYRRLWLTFKDGEMRARQRIEWQAAITLSAGYCAMLPLHRYETYTHDSEDTNSAQITGWALNDRDFEVEDYSERRAGQINWREGIRRWRLWGSYGTSGEVEVLEATGPLAARGGIQQSSYTYNKAYIGFSTSQVVSPGDVWTVDTRWRITASA